MKVHGAAHKQTQTPPNKFLLGWLRKHKFLLLLALFIISWRPDINLHKKHPCPKLRIKIIQVRNFFEPVNIKGDFSIIAVW